MVKEEQHPESNSKGKEAEKLSPEEHYFWIDERFISLLYGSLSKKAVLLYLLYARSCNPKHMQCSMASYKSATECLSLSHAAVDHAKIELVDKALIKLRPDIKTGYFKTTPVEVLNFPHIHDGVYEPTEFPRSIEKVEEKAIYIPSILIDEGKVKGLTTSELRTLLYLYLHCRWGECLGIDYQVLHAWRPQAPDGIVKAGAIFGEGFHPSLFGEDCYKVVTHEKWQANEESLTVCGKENTSVLDSLVVKGLLILVPVIIWEDPEDKTITEVRTELFPGLVKFQPDESNPENQYRLSPLDEEERVIWICRPVYYANNWDYKAYAVKRRNQYEAAYRLYAENYDVKQTHKKSKKIKKSKNHKYL